jgi:hypothetical protein
MPRIYYWIALAVAITAIGVTLAVNHWAVASICVFSLASVVILTGLVIEYGLTFGRILLRWPVRLLPANFASQHLYTVATLDAEFAQFREAFKDVEYFFQMLRAVHEYNESPVREEMGLGPHEYVRERSAADKYMIAKRSLWVALNNFIETYRRLA